MQSSFTSSKFAGFGALFIALALFACQDISAKYLSAFFPIPFLVCSRFIGNLVLNCCQAAVTKKQVFKGFITTRWKLQLMRSALLVGTTFSYFLAIKSLPLTTTISIFFLFPLFIATLAPYVVGEKMPAKRWIYIAAGMIGVLFVIKPGTQEFSWNMLFAALASMNFALFTLISRKLSQTESFNTTNLYTATIGSIVFLPAILLLFADSWEAPTNYWQWALALLMGVMFGGLGHFFLLHANRILPSPEIASWFYTQIFWMVLADYFIFSQQPDLYTMLGCSIVIFSNLLVIRIELKNARELAAAQASSSFD